MKFLRRALLWAALPATLALVIACGGDDDDGGDIDLADYPYPVQAIDPIESREHFPVGEVYNDYNSNPPTSGPHASQWAPWGVSDLAVAKEMAVHNMEHAGVVVWYNCNAEPRLDSGACGTLRTELSRVVTQEVAQNEFVLLTPYTEMDSRIALTAWGYLDTFAEFDEARITTFVDTFECNFDPENFC